MVICMKANILFVDDEEAILRSMNLIFGKTHNVFVANRGAQALEIIKQNDIKVIVCDQRMPQMLGVEVLKTVMEISPSTMRVLLTGYSDVSDIVDSINQAEIFRYIMKPWKNGYLREIVNLAIAAADETEDLVGETKIGDDVTQIPGETIVEVPEQVATDLLVIDDDKGTHNLISKFFSNKSCVFYASDLSEALVILDQNPGINFIVSELFVNNKQATDVLTAIKSRAPHIVIMVLTSFRDSELLFKLINEGQIFRFLLKPASQKMVGISLVRGLEKFQAMKSNGKLMARYSVDKSSRPESTEDDTSGSSEGSLITRALNLFRFNQ
jgi:DNA-binding NtrC family response regulator